MLFSTGFVSQIFSNTKGAVHDNLPIDEISTDSRKKTNKSLFIPIVGDSFDAHDFIKDAFNNGAVATIWDKSKELPDFLPTDFPVFFVDDTTTALQQLAQHYRNEVNPIVIGVTGSNGKTTTKDLIGNVVQTHFNTHRTKGNFNNQIGLPLTILSMPRDTQILVLEMGMDHFGEIELLSTISLPDYGVITNIGESHIEFLGSREGIAQAKSEILAGLKESGLLFIDGDEPLLKKLHTRDNVITVGFDNTNDVSITSFKMTSTQSTFTLGNNQDFQLNMLGKHNVKNATFAIMIAKKLNIPRHKVENALLHLELTGMRFESLKGQNGVTIINDAYNASPTSMKASIEVVKQMDGLTKKVLILGDIFELGDYSKSLHRSVAESITEDIQVVFTVGNDSKEITDEINNSNLNITAKHFESKEKLVSQLKPYLNDQTLIMFKASRGMKLETILESIVK